jgi:excinuclease ABC subunit A
LHGLSLPELNPLSLDEIYDLFAGQDDIRSILESARTVGLGYLSLYQPGYALSGGEAQRLKIARELWHKSRQSSLYILDEPTVGQHLADVQRLVDALQSLVDSCASVMVVEHHPHFLAACDWLVELGPGGGPQGGQVVASGTPYVVARGVTPIAPYLRAVLEDNL